MAVCGVWEVGAWAGLAVVVVVVGEEKNSLASAEVGSGPKSVKAVVVVELGAA